MRAPGCVLGDSVTCLVAPSPASLPGTLTRESRPHRGFRTGPSRRAIVGRVEADPPQKPEQDRGESGCGADDGEDRDAEVVSGPDHVEAAPSLLERDAQGDQDSQAEQSESDHEQGRTDDSLAGVPSLGARPFAFSRAAPRDDDRAHRRRPGEHDEVGPAHVGRTVPAHADDCRSHRDRIREGAQGHDSADRSGYHEDEGDREGHGDRRVAAGKARPIDELRCEELRPREDHPLQRLRRDVRSENQNTGCERQIRSSAEDGDEHDRSADNHERCDADRVEHAEEAVGRSVRHVASEDGVHVEALSPPRLHGNAVDAGQEHDGGHRSGRQRMNTSRPVDRRDGRVTHRSTWPEPPSGPSTRSRARSGTWSSGTGASASKNETPDSE